jgi:hypothetical protein
MTSSNNITITHQKNITAARDKPVVWKFPDIDYNSIEKEYDAIKREYACESKHYQRIIDDHLEFSRSYPTLFRFATSKDSQNPSNDAMVKTFISQAREAQKERRVEMDKEATELSHGLYDRYIKKK